MFRLQTVRYESIEVTQEMMKTKTTPLEPVDGNQYKCTFNSPSNLVIEQSEEQVEDCTEEISNRENEDSDNPPCQNQDADEHSNDSTSFGESLKKYLGLTGTSNFITVVKTNVNGSE